MLTAVMFISVVIAVEVTITALALWNTQLIATLPLIFQALRVFYTSGKV